MDASRRHETSESEMKRQFIIHRNNSSRKIGVCALLPQAPAPWGQCRPLSWCVDGYDFLHTANCVVLVTSFGS